MDSEPHRRVGEWTVLEKIGEGSFAQVRECVRDDGLRAVIKTTSTKSDRASLFVVRENATLLRVDSHPNIPEVFDVIETLGESHLVMEKCDGIELFEYLRQQKDSRLPESSVVVIMKQLLSALDFMHRRGVMHRDIKLDNILIDPETLAIKVIDFNLSSFFLPHVPMTESVGCLHYAHPKLLLSADGHDYLPERGTVDIWAAGVVCYGLLVGFFPFRSTQTRKLHREILTKSPQNLEWAADVSPTARDFVCHILDPLTSMSAMEMLQHPFLNDEPTLDRSTNGSDLDLQSLHISDDVRSEFVIGSTGRRVHMQKWACDTKGISESMVSMDDWRMVERTCSKYTRKMLEQRKRRHTSSDSSNIDSYHSFFSFAKSRTAPPATLLVPRSRTSTPIPHHSHDDLTDAHSPSDAESDAETLAHLDTIHSLGSQGEKPSILHFFHHLPLSRKHSTSSVSTAAHGDLLEPTKPTVAGERDHGHVVRSNSSIPEKKSLWQTLNKAFKKKAGTVA